MILSDWWRWTKAAPTLLPIFEPSENSRALLSDGPGEMGKTRSRGRGKIQSGLRSAFVGSEGRQSGRRCPVGSRTRNVCSGHGSGLPLPSRTAAIF